MAGAGTSNERQPLLPSPLPNTTHFGPPPELPITTSKPEPARIAYLDNLRVFLTALVVVHHAISAYGGVGWYVDAQTCSALTCLSSSLFNVLDESFFMATFFILSGYFSSASLSRKAKSSEGVWLFMKDKLKRLLIPWIGYNLIQEPLIRLAQLPLDGWSWKLVGEDIKAYFWPWQGPMGPMWFLTTLLAFDLFHLLIFTVKNVTRSKAKVSTPSQPLALASDSHSVTTEWSRRRFATTFVLAFAIVIPCAFVLRASPYRERPLVYFIYGLGYLGQLPQYILAYTAGSYLPIILPHLITVKLPWLRLLGSYILSAGCLLILSSPKWGYGRKTVVQFQGGWEFKYFLFETWDEFSFILLSTAWISVFSAYATQSTEVAKSKFAAFIHRILSFFTARHTFAVFLLHPPIVTFFIVWLDLIGPWRNWAGIGCFIKGLIVGGITVVLTWWIARGFVKIPWVGKIV